MATLPASLAPSDAGAARAIAREPSPTAARIGPNAIIQVAASIVAHAGAAEAEQLLATTSWTLHRLPSAMVDERDVTALMAAVMTRFPGTPGMRILGESGVRTADYLLRARIPRIAQWLLARLPARLALRALLAAIAKHAWTFAGSARFVVTRDTAGRIGFSLLGCPVCRGRSANTPTCAYYAATVERLVRVILAPRATVREVRCEAMGHEACHFTIEL